MFKKAKMVEKFILSNLKDINKLVVDLDLVTINDIVKPYDRIGTVKYDYVDTILKCIRIQVDATFPFIIDYHADVIVIDDTNVDRLLNKIRLMKLKHLSNIKIPITVSI